MEIDEVGHELHAVVTMQVVTIVERSDRQAAGQHIEDVRAWGEVTRSCCAGVLSY